MGGLARGKERPSGLGSPVALPIMAHCPRRPDPPVSLLPFGPAPLPAFPVSSGGCVLPQETNVGGILYSSFSIATQLPGLLDFTEFYLEH